MTALNLFGNCSKHHEGISLNLTCWLIVFLCLFNCRYANANDLRIVTENSYPVQYVEGDVIKGMNADTIKSMLKYAMLDTEIEVLPWAMAYNIAQTTPNVMIFSIARTPAREHEFIWGRPITDLSYSLYTLTDKQQTLSKMTSKQLKNIKVAAIRNSATQQYLTENNFTNLQLVNNPVQMINMLNNREIDAIPANSTSLAAFCQKMSLQCDLLTKFYPLSVPSTQLYFAFSKGTDPKIINRLLYSFDNAPSIEKLN